MDKKQIQEVDRRGGRQEVDRRGGRKSQRRRWADHVARIEQKGL